jgi:hypothetical protein
VTVPGVRNAEAESFGEVQNPMRRRAALVWASALVGGLATLLDRRPAQADDMSSPCCGLASKRLCSYTVSRDRFYCPSGYTRTVWSCRTGSGQLVWCGECASGSSCYDSPFYCSIWFYN